MDDTSLTGQMLAGNREAFTLLLARHYPSVRQLCQRVLHSAWDAEDVAQEAALVAFLSISQLRDPARFGAWFHAIAANLARKKLRSQKHWQSNQADREYVAALWTEDAQKPDDLFAAREVHDTIISALENLSSVNRKAVVGFYLLGYRYDELATLLGVPQSTVRGRLFQARRQLRETLNLVMPTRTRATRRRKEQPMKEKNLIEMQRSRFLFPFTPDGFASRTAIELRGKETTLAYALYLSKQEGEILANLPAQTTRDQVFHAEPQIVLQGLTLSMMEALDIQVKRVVVQRLIDSTFYATVILVQRKKEISIDVRPGEALILSAYTGAPIYTSRSVLDLIGYDWADLIAYITKPLEQQARDPQAYQAINQRIDERIEQETNPLSSIPFTPQALKSIEDCLGRLLTKSDAKTAFLVDHRTGTLVEWYGTGNKDKSRLFSRICGCRARSPQDLRDLLLYSHFLIGEIAQGAQMPFSQIGLYWQMNLVLSSDKDSHDVSKVIAQDYYAQATKELHEILDGFEREIEKGGQNE